MGKNLEKKPEKPSNSSTLQFTHLQNNRCGKEVVEKKKNSKKEGGKTWKPEKKKITITVRQKH